MKSKNSYRSYNYNKHKAFVLLSVLLVSTVLLSCATAFSLFVKSQVKNISQIRETFEKKTFASLLARSVINVFSELSSNFNSDNPTQKWLQPLVIELNDDLGLCVVQIIPLDDKIPVNNLFLPDGNTLRREFSQVLYDMWEKLEHTELLPLMLDFLDKNNKPRNGSIENDYFLNRSVLDISEFLILSQDFTPEILKELSDYCTVYSDGRINMNFAPQKVLELLPGLNEDLAARIIQERTDHALEPLRDIQSMPGASPRTSIQLTNLVTFKSRYFNLKISFVDKNFQSSFYSFSIIFDRNSRKILKWEEA